MGVVVVVQVVGVEEMLDEAVDNAEENDVSWLETRVSFKRLNCSEQELISALPDGGIGSPRRLRSAEEHVESPQNERSESSCCPTSKIMFGLGS